MEKPKLPPHLKPVPAERATYNAARQFTVAAKFISSQPEKDGKITFPIQPYITCVSFSIELYLKCILQIEGAKDVRGHKLAALFKQLSKAARDNVLFYLRGAYADLSLPEHFLNNELVNIDNSFVEWRYVHEKDFAHINLQFLRRFAWACQMHVRYLKKEWLPEGDAMPTIGS